MKSPVLQFAKVCLTYPAGGGPARPVLHDISFEIPSGRSVALAGRSGSGKSTLLHLAAGIMVPTSGRILLDGNDLGCMSEKQRTLARRNSVGQVFQFFHLLPHLTVAENVALPGWIAGQSSASIRQRADELLEQVELADRSSDPVGQLSGGEMQRVAICRALLRRPLLVLADEPTGSLDDTSGLAVMDLLLDLVRDEGATLLYVTHSRDLAQKADTAWFLADGRLKADGPTGVHP
jgi:putative ABC transport system ATP-binding protein